jgi:hypothetical protein
MIEVCAITCPKCNASIFSRTRHDFRSCPCGSIAIDGGLDYTKINFDPSMGAPKPFKLEINQTREELYHDWNLSEDKYGMIQPGLTPPPIGVYDCFPYMEEPPEEEPAVDEPAVDEPGEEKTSIRKCITDDGNHILTFDRATREDGTCHTMLSFKCIAGSCNYEITRRATQNELQALNLLHINQIDPNSNSNL